MLPNVLPHSASDHTPVLADEVRDLLAVQPGETVVDATFGAGGHARLLAQDLAGQRQARRDRPRPERQGALRPVQGAGRGGRALPPRRLRARAHAARRRTTSRPTRSCSTSASRRCRSTGPSAASRTPPTRRSTCGWIPRARSRPRRS